MFITILESAKLLSMEYVSHHKSGIYELSALDMLCCHKYLILFMS